ncbi:MAG: SDR family NAD(P)-dependent oxidoreductase [Cyclobacteriaceae bacterium]
MFDLKGKTAVVTGGGSGIGQSICRLFGQQGASVIILDQDQLQADETATEIISNGGEASAIQCDVSKSDPVRPVFQQIEPQSEQIDILINNAGIAHIGNLENTTESDLDRLYHVNVKGVYNCMKHAVPLMKKSGGAILNMASVVAMVAVPDRFAYSMTKGAVLTMTYSVARDYMQYGIRCNCIAPARVHTPFVDSYLSKTYPGKEKEMFEKLAKTQPIGRMGKPEEIAYLALFLCADEAAFITGTNYPIDGGFVTLST